MATKQLSKDSLPEPSGGLDHLFAIFLMSTNITIDILGREFDEAPQVYRHMGIHKPIKRVRKSMKRMKILFDLHESPYQFAYQNTDDLDRRRHGRIPRSHT